MTALETAQRLHAAGVVTVPVAYKSKQPTPKGWQNFAPTAEDLPRYFKEPTNIGLVNGARSGGLVDADLDYPEAVYFAYLLPTTGSVFGRASKPDSHRYYRCDPPPDTKQFKAPDGSMVVELRSTGTQTVIPPSVHECGEPIAYSQNGVPGVVDGAVLPVAVGKVAAGALLARHYPASGSRHNACLALAGGLKRAGWPLDHARTFVVAVAAAAGDEESGGRGADVDSTYARLDGGGNATGWPAAIGLFGKPVVDKVCEWLGVSGQSRADSPAEDWADPVPLGGFEPQPFPVDVLPEFAQGYVEALATETQTPPDLAAMLVLAAFALCAARWLRLRVPGGWVEPLCLYVLVVLRSGSRKSAVFKEVTSGIRNTSDC